MAVMLARSRRHPFVAKRRIVPHPALVNNPCNHREVMDAIFEILARRQSWLRSGPSSGSPSRENQCCGARNLLNPKCRKRARTGTDHWRVRQMQPRSNRGGAPKAPPTKPCSNWVADEALDMFGFERSARRSTITVPERFIKPALLRHARFQLDYEGLLLAGSVGLYFCAAAVECQ